MSNNTIYYDSAAVYVDSAKDAAEKIKRIDMVLDALLTNAMLAAENDNIREYSLNNGQTIIRTEYSGTDAVMKSYHAFMKIKQLYVSKINGRVARAVDGKSINRNRYGGR